MEIFKPESKLNIPLVIDGKEVCISLSSESNSESLFSCQSPIENYESPYQIVEGFSYEYMVPDDYCLEASENVFPFRTNKNGGRILPNTDVGTLSIKVINLVSNSFGIISLEVRSIKTDYRTEYQFMLKDIAEKSVDLLLHHSSPSSQYFAVDTNLDAKTLYQRFAFIKSIIETEEFKNSINKITSSPVTKWKETEVVQDIRNVKRLRGSALRQLASENNRIRLPKGHPLEKPLGSIPSRIRVNHKSETVDTPENQFVKHALITFENFCENIRSKIEPTSRLSKESGALVNKLEQFLNHSTFREISKPSLLPLNSPILQRKEGYREVLRVWLMFDLAAKLIWKGGEDVYSANKRNVAVLYEYWLFFKLLDIVRDVFKIDPSDLKDLIDETKDGLGLQLKQGKHLPIRGVYDIGTRKLNIQFSYNRTFSSQKHYQKSGSWTKNMRPDYTLSVWPGEISQDYAEEQELIVHLHFDAKYKVDNILELLGNIKYEDQSEEEINSELSKEEVEQSTGTFKRVDLLKMHAYKDAIKRTAGAYILYPGESSPMSSFKPGFHELLPGLRAFAIKPSESNDGSSALKKFIIDVVSHFMDRTSQREKLSLKTWQTFKEKKESPLEVKLPETIGDNRELIPDETYVLVGYYHEENWNWINTRHKYNTRTGDENTFINLKVGEVKAKFILLYTEGEIITSKLFRVKDDNGPQILPKSKLVDDGYNSHSSSQFYLVYDLKKDLDEELKNMKWDISQLEEFNSNPLYGLPFAITLSKLMKVVCK